jgi:hypothetical protein
MQGAQAKAAARRGAVVDLQRNLAVFLTGGGAFSEAGGVVRSVEVLQGTWDGTFYKVSGRVRVLPHIR